MLKTRKILLASHDTPGARRAEQMALTLCRPGTTLVHLVVVPDFWKGMMGDDWLNNASTRAIYADYVETQLEQDVRRHIRRLMLVAAKRKLRYRFEVEIGKPADCLIALAKKTRFDVIVLGSRRPKGRSGLRSTMLEERLFRSIKAPILVAPYPHG